MIGRVLALSSLLGRPPVIYLAILIILSLLLWFFGPAIAFNGQIFLRPVWLRGGLIVFFSLLWLAIFSWQYWRQRQLGSPTDVEQWQVWKQFIQRHTRAVQAAVRASASYDKSRRRPCYLLLGECGAGKSSLLQAAGLSLQAIEAPDTDYAAFQAWISEEATWLEITVAADSIAWSILLEQLRRQQRFNPVCGIILVLATTQMIDDPDSLAQQAQLCRQQIHSLKQALRRHLPLYLVVNQLDRLDGFTSYFASLGQVQREQCWSINFPESIQTDSTRGLMLLEQESKLIEQKLQAGLIESMQQHNDQQQQALYAFPYQFVRLAEVTQSFCCRAFSASHYLSPTLWRGVWFCAAQPAASEHHFSSERTRQSGYFVGDFLTKQLPAELGLARSSMGWTRYRHHCGKILLGLCLLFLITMSSALLHAWQTTRQDLRQTMQTGKMLAEKSQTSPTTLAAALPLLASARQLPAGCLPQEQQVAGWWRRWGLGQGEPLCAQSLALYQRLLHSSVQQAIIHQLETDLQRARFLPPEQLSTSLHVYLMLARQLPWDAHNFTLWGRAWSESRLELTTAEQNELFSHVQALAELSGSAPAISTDARLIQLAQVQLAQTPPAQQLYSIIKQQLLADTLPPLDLVQGTGAEVLNLLQLKSGQSLQRALPGLFTHQGYLHLLQLLDDQNGLSKTLGVSMLFDLHSPQHMPQALRAAALQLYFADYIRQWERLLGDISLLPAQDLAQSSQLLSRLAAPASPLRKLLLLAARETALVGLAPAADEQARVVDRHFEYLQAFAKAPDNSTLGKAIEGIQELGGFLSATEQARKAGLPPPPDTIVQKVAQLASDQNLPLHGLLKAISQQSQQQVQLSNYDRLNLLWQSQILPFCRQAIVDRYPFKLREQKEVTAFDFGYFFAHGGLLDEFFQRHFQSIVDVTKPRWLFHDGADPGVASVSLDMFQRAAHIRDSYFPTGGKQPSFRFQLKPLQLPPTIQELSVDVDGVNLLAKRDNFGPPVLFQLGSVKGGGEISLRYQDEKGSRTTAYQGNWSIFRFLDTGDLQPTSQPERFLVDLDLGGQPARIELLAHSVRNPFRRELLTSFRCVDKL
ncbi:ImcF-related family protein [Chromobacterium haemolyticum]|uniref:Type VI secretion system membrane subunit TssM n=1 Tax=Chromobacterium haemolyticum TaxID=394935 RepID=A0A1W0CE31_9NEIS|nr:ImcF-related family protein [Chromobacterium haemolyticum]OQS32962.1 hypothetical protein B0T45_21030 [Chromobacterium haemolyticum]